AQSEALRKMLEGKLTLRVALAHASDLQNVLDLRQQYPIDVVVTGGADAWKFASVLSNAGIPVVYALAADAAPDVAAGPAERRAAPGHLPRPARHPRAPVPPLPAPR